MDCYIQRGTNVNDIIVENDKCSTLQNKVNGQFDTANLIFKKVRAILYHEANTASS